MGLTDDQIKQAFCAFDADGSGQISASELSQVMTQLGHCLTADQINQVLTIIDTDGSGQISAEEFTNFVRCAEKQGL